MVLGLSVFFCACLLFAVLPEWHSILKTMAGVLFFSTFFAFLTCNFQKTVYSMCVAERERITPLPKIGDEPTTQQRSLYDGKEIPH